MPTDFIMMHKSTPNKPEISMLARLLNCTEGEAFLWFFRWLILVDENMRDGKIERANLDWIDTRVGRLDFGVALSAVGWVDYDAERDALTVPHWHRWNGKNAKSRLLATERMRSHRASHARDAAALHHGNGTPSLKEKRSYIHPKSPRAGEASLAGTLVSSRKGRSTSTPRANGTNPRALGTNPRATGANPRAQRQPRLLLPKGWERDEAKAKAAARLLGIANPDGIPGEPFDAFVDRIRSVIAIKSQRDLKDQ